MNKISVCVPTYNRPDTLRQLIYSYLRQDYENKELIISDDTQNDSIKILVNEFKDPSIKYFHNKVSLRFAKNLYTSMKRAKGKYLVIIGDDDVLLNRTVLSQYVNTFEKFKDVSFIYSNQVQFSDKMQIEYIINFTSRNRYFKKGIESMKHIWMRSLFIGGLGIRNTKNILRYYPKDKTLYPQVEFIGNIVNNYDSYLLNENNIGFRSHDNQIIFRALKDKTLRQEGDHTTVEFFSIFNKLKKKYKLKITSEFLENELINLQFILMFKEKSNLGSKGMAENYYKFTELSTRVKMSKKLKIGFYLAYILPSISIIYIRKLSFVLMNLLNKQLFIYYKKNLISMTTPFVRHRNLTYSDY